MPTKEEGIGPIEIDRIDDLLVQVHSEQPGDPA